MLRNWGSEIPLNYATEQISDSCTKVTYSSWHSLVGWIDSNFLRIIQYYSEKYLASMMRKYCCLESDVQLDSTVISFNTKSDCDHIAWLPILFLLFTKQTLLTWELKMVLCSTVMYGSWRLCIYCTTDQAIALNSGSSRLVFRIWLYSLEEA